MNRRVAGGDAVPPSGGNKQTFSKVPPKRHAYKSGQNANANQNANNEKRESVGMGGGQASGPGAGSNQENQLLYKIKIINNPVKNANTAHMSKKKGQSVFN